MKLQCAFLANIIPSCFVKFFILVRMERLGYLMTSRGAVIHTELPIYPIAAYFMCDFFA